MIKLGLVLVASYYIIMRRRRTNNKVFEKLLLLTYIVHIPTYTVLLKEKNHFLTPLDGSMSEAWYLLWAQKVTEITVNTCISTTIIIIARKLGLGLDSSSFIYSNPCLAKSSYVRLFITFPSVSSNSSSWLPVEWNLVLSIFIFPLILLYKVRASSIKVISWKCFVLGMPKHLMPWACLNSWKCLSNARRPI